jgi:hypothetical protein
MTTWGTFSILVCIFIMPPIVLLNHSKLSFRKLCLIGFPSILVANHLGWTFGPMIFRLMETGAIEFPVAQSQYILVLCDVAVAIIVTGILVAAKQRREKNEVERRHTIQEARVKILADGVVHGPKGPYVPHKSWNVGIDPHTSGETKGPEGHGPYGLPMK